MMTKKDFISLADVIRWLDHMGSGLTTEQLGTLADWCAQQNPAFKRRRWLDYIDGLCGPNGGALK